MKHLTLLVALSPLWLSPEMPARAADQPSIAKWIKQLGSDEFAEREKATKRLLALEEVPPELLEARTSSDLEIRRRAKMIHDAIEHKFGLRVLDIAARQIQNGEFDQAVERLVRWADMDPNGHSLGPLSRFAGKLVEKEILLFGKIPMANYTCSMHDPLETPKNWRFRASHDPLSADDSDHLLALRAPQLTLNTYCAFAACSGEVKFVGCMASTSAGTTIFSSSSITLTGKNFSSVLVSDGDVDASKASYLTCSLIIARGDVTLPPTVRKSTVLAGGRVKKRGDHKELKDCTIREHDLDGLGLIKFFDPKKQGIEVTEAKAGVRVKAVAKDKPFAAVLHAGDMIAAVNGKATASPESFRKVLRAALAEERQQLPVTIRRGGESMTVRVPMKR